MGQLADPGRSAKTKVEAAGLLLTRPYPQATEKLLEFLGDGANRPAQIAVAEAIALDGLGRAEFAQPLLDLLAGGDPSVRAAAAKALVTYKNGGVVDKLVAVATDAKADRDVRLVTIAALQRVLDKKVVDALVGLLGDGDGAVRDAAAESLIKLTNIRAFGKDPAQWRQWWRENKDRDRSEWLADLTESLAKANAALEDDNDRLRDRLARAMEDLYAATPPAGRNALLLSFLKDPLADVQLVGAALTERKLAANEPIPPEIPAQIRAMLQGDNVQARAAAALLLADLGDSKDVELLLERLGKESAPPARQALLKALGQLQDLKALPVVLAEIGSTYDDTAASAAEALAGIATRHSLEGKTRDQAVKALVGRYSQRVDVTNGTALREALLRAMGVLADEAFVDVMTAAVKDPAATVRLAAVDGLARIGNDKCLPKLVPLAGDADRGVRRAALVALKTLGGESQLRTILRRTDPAAEADRDVREQAWDVAMEILAKADGDVLAGVVKDLAKRADAAEQRLRIMQMWVDALKARKSSGLPDARRDFGLALMQVGRSAEAAAQLSEAHALFAAAKDSPKALDVWAQWLIALLADGDVQALKLMADQDDDDAFDKALASLTTRIDQARKAGKHLTAIALADQAIKQLPQRLTVPQREALDKALTASRQAQAAIDRQRVAQLAPQLLSGDDAARRAAEAELKAMGPRAVLPLLAELTDAVAAEKPNPRLEEALLAVVKSLAPKLDGYDPTAPKADRLAVINGWRQDLKES